MVILRACDTAFVRSNRACDDVLGSFPSLVGNYFLNLVDYGDLETTSQQIDQVVQSNVPATMTHRIGIRGRTICWTVCPLPDGYLVLTGRDITVERQGKDRLYRLAYYDDITGLPNRLLFRDRGAQGLAVARRENRRAAVVFLDLDDFKPVNDLYGHSTGDEVLREISRRLEAEVRDTDTVCRLGGDEFVVFLSLLHGSSAEQIVDRLVKALDLPYFTSRGEVTVNTSYGFALFPDDGTDLDALVGIADDRMYVYKKSKDGNR